MCSCGDGGSTGHMLSSGITNRTNVEQCLYICLALYYQQHHELYINNHAGIEQVLNCWFYPFVTEREVTDVLARYPTTSYPDSCVCGNAVNSTGSILRYECITCEGVPDAKYLYITQYDFQLLAGHINMHYRCYMSISLARLKSILAMVIYDSNINGGL